MTGLEDCNNEKQRARISALSRQGYDRIPIKHCGTPEINALLSKHFAITTEEELLRTIGDDFRIVEPVYRGPELRTFPDPGHVRSSQRPELKNVSSLRPLLSPKTYREFILPHMRRLVEFYKQHGVRYVMVDTDGNSEPPPCLVGSRRGRHLAVGTGCGGSKPHYAA